MCVQRLTTGRGWGGGSVRSLLISPLKLETGTDEDIARILTQGAGGEGTNAVSDPCSGRLLSPLFC